MADEWPLVLSCSISLSDCCRPFISDGRPLFDALKLRGLFMWAPGVCVPDLICFIYGWGNLSLRAWFVSLKVYFLKLNGLDAKFIKKALGMVDKIVGL